jgi:hypothetical protein
MRKLSVTMLAVGVTLLGLAAVRAFASESEQQAHGLLTSHVLTVEQGCTSAIGLCTAGRLDGTINGDFVFTADKLIPSDTPGVFFYTGHIVVDTSRGQVTCQDAGVFQAAPSPPGGVVDLCTIVAGTGDWAGVLGHIRIHGTFTFAEGGFSHYEGVISH